MTSDSIKSPFPREGLTDLANRIGEALQQVSDKEWNYSRIRLVIRDLNKITGPYCLSCELLDVAGRDARRELKEVEDEIAWGERHSSELGILEIVSLRLNQVLMEVCKPDSWGGRQPIIRVVQKDALQQQGVTSALWYEVEEVSGEEFENR